MQSKVLLPFCLFLAFSLIMTIEVSAQSAPNSLSPGSSGSPSTATAITQKKKHKKKFFSPLLTRTTTVNKKPNVKHTARYEYWDRIEQAAKEKKRILKELAKDQYQDARYFGHKKLPRKRAAHKMRYCSECGIRH